MKNTPALDALAACAGVAVIAGHYCVAPELEDLSHEGDAEVMSFRKGAEIHRDLVARGVASQLCLWVNDIGIGPDERAAMKASYQPPANYLEIAATHGLAAGDVTVLFESTARNKASTWLRKIAKDRPELFRQNASSDTHLVRCVDGVMCGIGDDKMAYVLDGPDGESLVVKDGPNPKCNLILATLFQMLQRKSNCQGIVNVFNDIYVNRIRLGLHVYRKVYDPGSVTVFENYFCGDGGTRQESFVSKPELAVA